MLERNRGLSPLKGTTGTAKRTPNHIRVLRKPYKPNIKAEHERTFADECKGEKRLGAKRCQGVLKMTYGKGNSSPSRCMPPDTLDASGEPKPFNLDSMKKGR